jgi:CHAT domain-containing protein
MLLTDTYEGDLRQAPWLVNRFATTTLPGASTLRALRAVARPVQASEPFLGVGDPVLAGLPDDGPARGPARGTVRVTARGPGQGPTQGPAQATASGGARPLFARRGRSPQMSRLFTRSGLADVRALRELPPLPETADELRALAHALGAGGDALLLAADATKRRVRSMDLSHYRVIAFATHGLTAGDVPGYGEPGLVLTPPDRATPEDDGVLGVSTIARLRLDADLVILSACNTASPDGTPGAEALSGLARAFLYAGARSLLVSHWPVVSTSAVELTTGLVAAQQADPAIGRAEALRRSQQHAITAAPSAAAAHPVLWAPFVLVGEGGRPIAVAAAGADEEETPAQ